MYIFTVISLTTALALYSAQETSNPYSWKTPIKKLQHVWNMNVYGSNEASLQQQEDLKKALAETGVETSLPIYASDVDGAGYVVTKTGIWLKDRHWRDANVQGPKYRHYYVAAHVKNGTVPQPRESEDEKYLKPLVYGLIPGPSILFGSMKLGDHLLKNGRSLALAYPVMFVGAVLSYPAGIIVSGVALRYPTLKKRQMIEDNAEKLATQTIDEHYNQREAFKITQHAPSFKAW